jgi:pilus assembly protein CpaE
VLAAPLRPEDAELIVESKVTALIEVARSSYDAIVVDTSPFFHGPMLATLDRTDQLLILCGLDVPTLKNVRLALQTLELLKTREVEEGLKVKVGHELPLDRNVQVCVNRGEPAVLADPRSDFARGIAALAKQVAPKNTTARQPKGRRMLSFARA